MNRKPIPKGLLRWKAQPFRILWPTSLNGCKELALEKLWMANPKNPLSLSSRTPSLTQRFTPFFLLLHPSFSHHQSPMKSSRSRERSSLETLLKDKYSLMHFEVILYHVDLILRNWIPNWSPLNVVQLPDILHNPKADTSHICTSD